MFLLFKAYLVCFSFTSLHCQLHLVIVIYLPLLYENTLISNSTSRLLPSFPRRLYRSLGDYDVVRGIFGGKIGTKAITCSALQAEAKSDYAEAVKLYNEVLVSVNYLISA